MSSRGPPVSASPVSALQAGTATFSCYTGSADPKSEPPAYIASTLPTAPSLQPNSIIFNGGIIIMWHALFY